MSRPASPLCRSCRPARPKRRATAGAGKGPSTLIRPPLDTATPSSVGGQDRHPGAVVMRAAAGASVENEPALDHPRPASLAGEEDALPRGVADQRPLRHCEARPSGTTGIGRTAGAAVPGAMKSWVAVSAMSKRGRTPPFGSDAWSFLFEQVRRKKRGRRCGSGALRGGQRLRRRDRSDAAIDGRWRSWRSRSGRRRRQDRHLAGASLIAGIARIAGIAVIAAIGEIAVPPKRGDLAMLLLHLAMIVPQLLVIRPKLEQIDGALAAIGGHRLRRGPARRRAARTRRAAPESSRRRARPARQDGIERWSRRRRNERGDRQRGLRRIGSLPLGRRPLRVPAGRRDWLPAPQLCPRRRNRGQRSDDAGAAPGAATGIAVAAIRAEAEAARIVAATKKAPGPPRAAGATIAASRRSSSDAPGHRRMEASDHPGRARARHLEQAESIDPGAGAGGEHEIVGGMLLLDPKLANREPDHRLEPVERAGQARRQPHRAVEPGDMGELVKQDQPPSLLRPADGIGGKQISGDSSNPQVIGIAGSRLSRRWTRRAIPELRS